VTAKMLHGKPVAAEIESVVAQEAKEFLAGEGRKPALSVVLVGHNPASEVYVRRKREACERVGIYCRVVHKADSRGLEYTLKDLSEDDGCDGVLLQLPLPGSELPAPYFHHIAPEKDVDVFNPTSVGLLDQGRFPWSPCTPAGVLKILQHYHVPTSGREMVIVNRSWVVGRPLAGMSLHKGVDATVTVCHDMTPHSATSAHCRRADIVVVAVGKPNFLTPDMVRRGQTVIDVGINRVDNRVIGDADPAIAGIVENLTPVPGGVGPLTVAFLIQNVVKAARTRRE
jgi:methylenetetrahydrofolate dehydrogenase (NADP+)/methenyltetrahydrofolate cyclohydrolase